MDRNFGFEGMPTHVVKLQERSIPDYAIQMAQAPEQPRPLDPSILFRKRRAEDIIDSTMRDQAQFNPPSSNNSQGEA